jgi:hypothetical protein
MGDLTLSGSDCSKVSEYCRMSASSGLIYEFASKLARKMKCHSMALARDYHRICNP